MRAMRTMRITHAERATPIRTRWRASVLSATSPERTTSARTVTSAIIKPCGIGRRKATVGACGECSASSIIEMLSRLPTPDLTGTGGCQPGQRRRCRRTKEALASVAIALTRDKVPAESICSQVACELATNACVHSQSCEPGGHFTVRAVIRGGQLRVEVHDDGGPWTRPVHRRDGQHGRGLLILAQLASDWGRTGDSATGWTIWFTMTLDGPAAAA